MYPFKYSRQAASEYGRLVTEAAKQGITPSKELAKAWAKMAALSQVAGVSIVTRNRAMEAAEEIERNSERTSGLYRPSPGGGNLSRAPVDSSPRAQISPEDELKAETQKLMQSIIGKR